MKYRGKSWIDSSSETHSRFSHRICHGGKHGAKYRQPASRQRRDLCLPPLAEHSAPCQPSTRVRENFSRKNWGPPPFVFVPCPFLRVPGDGDPSLLFSPQRSLCPSGAIGLPDRLPPSSSRAYAYFSSKNSSRQAVPSPPARLCQGVPRWWEHT